MNELIYSEDWESCDFESIIRLYQSVGWWTYANNPSSLRKAFAGSSLVLICLHENEVLGVLRSMSDEVSIHYIQDILVHPEYQHRGIGRALMNKALLKYASVRTHLLLTDTDQKQIKFYESSGFENLKTFRNSSLNGFVKICV